MILKTKCMRKFFLTMIVNLSIITLVPYISNAMTVNNSSVNNVEIVLTIGSNTYFKNGTTNNLDVPPYIAEDNRTMVPIRFIAEGLGAEVTWVDPEKMDIISLDGNSVYCKVGVSLEDNMGTPVIVNNRLFVPVRYIATALGATINWDGNLNQVIIKKAANPSNLNITNDYQMLPLSDFPEGYNYVEAYQFVNGYPAGITPRAAALKALEAYIADEVYTHEILKAPVPAKPINVVIADYIDYSNLYDMECYKIEFYSGGEQVNDYEIDLNGNRYHNFGRGPTLIPDDYYVRLANSQSD